MEESQLKSIVVHIIIFYKNAQIQKPNDFTSLTKSNTWIRVTVVPPYSEFLNSITVGLLTVLSLRV